MDFVQYLGLGLMVLLFLTGSPLAVVFSIGSITVLIFSMEFPIPNIAQLFFSAINSYTLLAMPFFILAGNILLFSGAMVPLRDCMNALVGHWRGGLAVATIIFSAFLGSISGSAAACLAIIGTIIIPILIEEGYDRPFASGLTVTTAELGLLIPPSLFFIIFGSYNRVSIADLFISGIGPGLLSALLMSIWAVIISSRRKYKVSAKASWSERGKHFYRVIPLVLMPLLVLGGIYRGFFSPTQAAAVAVYYAILLGVFVYKGLTWEGFTKSLVDTVKLSSMIYLIIIGGDLCGKVLGYIELPQMIAGFVIDMELGPFAFLIAVEVLLLIMGFFFSSIPMVIIVLPLFMPTVHSLGIDPVFYGCLAIFCSLISEITPPMGPQLWIAAPICKERMGAIAREAWPFLGAQVIALFLTTLFPGLSMFLVDLMR